MTGPIRPSGSTSNYPPLPSTGPLSLKGTSGDRPISPEMLLPRLGDFLIEKGAISPEQLSRALEVQTGTANLGQKRLIGQVLVDLGFLQREQLDRLVTEQILALQETLRETNRQLEARVQERTKDLERRYVQIRTAAEVAQNAISSISLDALLRTTVHLIVERFNYYAATIFLLEEDGKSLLLREAAGPAGIQKYKLTYRLPVSNTSIVGWVANQRQTRVLADVSQDTHYTALEQLPDTHSEAALPLIIGPDMIGVLDVQSNAYDAFSPEDVAVLQILANQIAAGVQNLRLLETTQSNLQEINLLYRASHAISDAQTPEEVLDSLRNAISSTPYVAVLLLAKPDGLHVFHMQDPFERMQPRARLNLSASDVQPLFSPRQTVLTVRAESNSLPAPVSEIATWMKCSQIALLPVMVSGKVYALCGLGSREASAIPNSVIQPYASLTEFTSTALEKLIALETTSQRLQNMEALTQIGQAISAQTELRTLYPTIHQFIAEVMDDPIFFIALYDRYTDRISFPYFFEDGQLTQIDSVPLGSGLTSLIVKERKSLFMVQDTEHQAALLGARQIGTPAKSWVGVPLILDEEVIGVISVQNTENEFAFDADDLRFLEAIAPQIALAIRNARMLEIERQRADQERKVLEITERVRSANDVRTILERTANELVLAFGADYARVELSSAQTTPETEQEPRS